MNIIVNGLKKTRLIVTKHIKTVIYLYIVPLLIHHLLNGIKNNDKKPSNIMIVRLDGLGDSVLSLPFLKPVRIKWPKSKITMVAQRNVAELYKNCPWIDEVISVETPPKRYLCRLIWGLFIGKKLAFKKYDLALSPRYDEDDFGAAWVCLGSGVGNRWGFSNVGERKNYRALIYNHIWKSDKNPKHEVMHIKEALDGLDIKIKALKMDLWISRKEIRIVKSSLKSSANDETETLIALGVGAGDVKRRWPIERYVQLAQKVKAKILVLCGRDENELMDYMKEKLGNRVLDVEGLDLRMKILLLKQCSVFIGNDSGPMHLAAAVGVPVVEISCHPKTGEKNHSNSPVRFQPWGTKAIVLQPNAISNECLNYCISNHAHCILDIDVKDVLYALRKIIKYNTFHGVK